MTKPSAEPREWWIDPSETDESEDCDVRQFDAFDKHPGQGDLNWQSNLVHVIEHSAYAAVCAERDEWKETWAEAIKWKPYLHFCMSAWDGLLIDQTDEEFDACTCFKHKPARRNHDNEVIKETLKLTDEIARLKKQNEVLRAALEQIAKRGEHSGAYYEKIASAALAEAEEVGE